MSIYIIPYTVFPSLLNCFRVVMFDTCLFFSGQKCVRDSHVKGKKTPSNYPRFVPGLVLVPGIMGI